MTARGGRPGGDQPVAAISGARRGSRETWVEVPRSDGGPAAWCYSDRRAYRAGDTVSLYVSATVPQLRLRIRRDDASSAPVHGIDALDVGFQPIPERVYEAGCDWPVSASWQIPADLRSGGYLVELSTALDGRDTVIGHHLFMVRARAKTPRTIALVAATCTWAAYNDWGGANHYYGLHPGTPRGRSPLLAANRPWARGQVWLPDGAPRGVNATRPTRPGIARYEALEWAFMNGYSRYCSVAGWASYERPFLLWLEAHGYEVDVLTQDELHEHGAALLADYRCALFVGHDEYWSREMRDAVDAYVDDGGRVARFAGNFMWQIRLEDGGRRQVAYKYDARELDPLARTDRSRMTAAWEDPQVGHPGAATFGVNALRGIYAAFGGMARRAARGFNVFRPRHWAFAGTGLAYADMFGDEANIFGFEMDGLAYTFRDGLPFPTFEDGAPASTEILAMGWATLAETGLPEHEASLTLGDGDARYRESLLGGSGTPESVDRHSRGSGMVVHFTRGRGEVFTAGTCEWVSGLIRRDWYTERITHNVLGRYVERRDDAA